MNAAERRETVPAGHAYWVALAGITVLGAALRFWDLGGKPFWLDEIYTYFNTIKVPVAAQLQMQFFFSFYLLAQRAIGAVVDSPAGFRLLSAVSGAATVPLLAELTRRALGRKAALLVAAYGAVSLLAVYYSQEARAYAFSMLLSLAFTLCWLRWLQTTRRRFALGFAVGALLAQMTTFSPLILAAVELAIMLVWPHPDAPEGNWEKRPALNIRRYGMRLPLAVFGLTAMAGAVSITIFAPFLSKLQGGAALVDWATVRELFAFFLTMTLVLEGGSRLLWVWPGRLSQPTTVRLRQNLLTLGGAPAMVIAGLLGAYAGGWVDPWALVNLLFAQLDPALSTGSPLTAGVFLPRLVEFTRYLAGDGGPLWVIFLVGYVFGLQTMLPVGERWSAGSAVALAGLFAAVGIVIFQALTYHLGVRYLMVVHPLLLATWGGGAMALLRRAKVRRWSAVAVALLVALVVGLSAQHLATYYRSPIRWLLANDDAAAFELICAEHQPGDVVLGVDQFNFIGRYAYARVCPDGWAPPQVNLFLRARLAHPDYRFSVLFDSDQTPGPMKILIVEPNAADKPVTLPWPARRFWVVGFMATPAAPANDPLPWWRVAPPDHPEDRTELASGGSVYRKGAMVAVVVENPSEAPTVFTPTALAAKLQEAMVLFMPNSEQ
jgi:hypothetical protein